MRWPSLAAVAVGGAFLLAPSVAAAHTAFLGLGSFWAGVLHPLTALDEAGFLLGLAIWAGLQRQRRDAGVIGAAFAGCLAGALALYLSRRGFAATAPTALLMIVVGLAGALRFEAGAIPLLVVAAAGGSVLGAASAEGTVGVSILLYALGAAIATASLVSYGLIVATRAGAAWMQIGLRAGASWIAAVGLMLAALEGTRLLGHR